MTDDLQQAIAKAPLVETAQACVAECKSKWPLVSIEALIETFMRKNVKGENLPFMGINKDKEIVPTAANTGNVDSTKYNVLCQGEFVFSGMQTGRDICIRIALSQLQTPVLLSPAYTTFKIKKEAPILAEFFFLNFKSQEMDRRGWFKSDSSVRSNLDWDRFCEIKIPLPPIDVQQQYVDAYQGLTGIIEQNEALLKLLEETAQACVAECREKWPIEEVGSFLEETDDRNTDEELDLNAVRGISIEKCFTQTKADMEGVSLRPYKIISPREFAYVTVTSRNGNKISIAMNSSEEEFLVSSSYAAFRVRDDSPLEPEYLYLQFKRPEFDRYARFNSWGSARETFNWEDMCRVKIPLPPIEVQRAIVALYHCAEEARKIAAEARQQLLQVCPAMIQRASLCR